MTPGSYVQEDRESAAIWEAVAWLQRSRDSKSPSVAKVHASVILARLEAAERKAAAREVLATKAVEWRAENERLREALERITALDERWHHTRQGDIARATLVARTEEQA